MADSSDQTTTEQALVIERVFDAPRELVWQAWTEAERFARWYGPPGFTVPECEIKARVGGRFFVCMRPPQGEDYRTVGAFREVVPHERLVYSDSPADADGNPMPGMETLVTVTFEDVAGKTKMTMRHEGLPAGAYAEGASAGWNGAFEKLAAYLVEAA